MTSLRPPLSLPRRSAISARDVESFIADARTIVATDWSDRGQPRFDLSPVVGRAYIRLERTSDGATWGFLDMRTGCLLRPAGDGPDPIPRGNLVDVLDPSRGRSAVTREGPRLLDDPSLDREMLRRLRARYASDEGEGRRAPVRRLEPASPTPEARRRFEAALLADDPTVPLHDGLRAGWLDAMIPEIVLEMDFLQRTRYHHLTNLEHSFAVCAAMPPNLLERLAGLFHDIGKRRTTTIKARNGDEQYLGHAPVGARMTRDILERLGYPDELVRRVCRLVFLHMVLHMAVNQGRSEKAQAKLLSKLGEDRAILQRLQLADIDAMHPDIAPESRARAEEYHRLLDATAAATPRGGPGGPGGVAGDDEDDERGFTPAIAPGTFLATFPRPIRRAARPRIVAICGLPASGKSYLARQVLARVAAAHVSSDDVRMALTGGQPSYSGAEHGVVFGVVQRLTADLLREGYHVVADATGVRARDRRSMLRDGDPATSVIVWCEADEATAARRLARRAAGADPDDRSEADASIRARMAARCSAPTKGEASLVLTCTPATVEATRDVLVFLLEHPEAGALDAFGFVITGGRAPEPPASGAAPFEGPRLPRIS